MDYKQFYSEIKNVIRAKVSEGRNTKNKLLILIEARRQELLKEGAVCSRCQSDKELTIDHIVPISYLENFGLGIDALMDMENLQILCRPCNQFKSDRLDFSNPKTKPLLKKFVDLI